MSKADNDGGFEELLRRIRDKEHPKYGVLSWDGIHRVITATECFEREPGEPDAVVRGRALRYLMSLTEQERAAVEVEVSFRNDVPVGLKMKARTNDLNPQRLEELKRAAGIP